MSTLSSVKDVVMFTVFGEPASKANSRKLVTLHGKPRFIKSKKAIKIDEKISLYLTRPENQGRYTVETVKVVRKEPIGFAMQFVTEDTELLESPEETDIP